MRILLYTFYNFPYKEILYSPYIFKKLNNDLASFAEMLEKEKTNLIIGVAKSPNSKSHFETKAINKFNKIKAIDKNGIEFYNLNYPQKGFGNIGVNYGTTDSFCNWTMYKISVLLKEKNINLQFIHISKSELNLLKMYIEEIQR